MASTVAELEAIASKFPGRDSRGYVTAFYVYARGINSREISGPHATMSDAETAREADRKTCMDALDIVCGHVFTSRGTIVRHLDVEAGGAGPVTIGRADDLQSV